MRGWLFDLYPAAEGMILWFLDAEGRPHRLLAEYHPAFYAAGPRAVLDRLGRILEARGIPADLTPVVRQELFSGAELPVLRVGVRCPLQFPLAVRQAATLRPLTLYTCDLSPAQLFLYERDLFPLGEYDLVAEDGVLREAIPRSRPEDLEYALPPLVVMRLRLDGDPINPNHGWRGELAVAVEGEEVVLSGEYPEDVVRSLNRMLSRYDPDVLLSEWGDTFLLPRLLRISRQVGQPLLLNRDPRAGIARRRGRSYVTYGKTVYTAGAHLLHGRWHLDLRNSFIYSESEMAGLLEIARLARLPVQRLARTSTGTAISSMQLARAVQQQILVPWHKSEPEAFKTAAELLLTDKGGLTYQPLVGVYEGVGELDFSSMYPTIMARFNISPETINCSCCRAGEVVPEVGYRVCRRRRGLVPQVLDHLLERRAYYKRRKRETFGSERSVYDQRQTALKWCLVTCLDAETQVPVKVNGQLRVAPIREIVDAFLPDGPGVLPVKGLYAFGYDERLRPMENPVKHMIKAPAPPQLLRLRLQFGRQLRMIPEHRCFVIEDGRLTVKRAAELREGDLIPVASSLPFTDQRISDGCVGRKETFLRISSAEMPPQRHGPFVCYQIRSIGEIPPSSPFVYCFEVERDLHGFVVSGGIFTANSFGYLGYRNARYGRIEAHEATTAYAREMLLRAKEVAEARGFCMLHAIVDSMWLQRPGAGQAAYEALAREIEGVTKLPIFVEGVYNWVVFLPSRTHVGVGVPNRYMGVFEDGTTKVRGIEVRRSDVPALVEEMQARMLQEMFAAPTVAVLRERLPEILAVLEEALLRVREGSVRPRDLALSATISRSPDAYRSNHPIALAARMLARSGIRLHPGEAVQYVVTEAKARVPEDRVRPLTLLGPEWSYDRDYYAELLIRAAGTILEPFGYSQRRLWGTVSRAPTGQIRDEVPPARRCAPRGRAGAGAPPASSAAPERSGRSCRGSGC